MKMTFSCFSMALKDLVAFQGSNKTEPIYIKHYFARVAKGNECNQTLDSLLCAFSCNSHILPVTFDATVVLTCFVYRPKIVPSFGQECGWLFEEVCRRRKFQRIRTLSCPDWPSQVEVTPIPHYSSLLTLSQDLTQLYLEVFFYLIFSRSNTFGYMARFLIPNFVA